MSDSPDGIKRESSSFWLALLPCVAAVAFFAYFRLVVYHDRVFPLSSALPLLLCLWNRDLRLLYGIAISLTVITLFKVFVVLPEGVFPQHYEWVMLGSQFINIWLVTVVIHGLIKARARLLWKKERLELLNAELEASNEELAAREEEITQQNEELQSQAEELEQQSEELRQQTEEMEQQGTELQSLNQELVRREQGLETLLNSSGWLSGDMTEEHVISGICQAGIQIMCNEAQAAEVVANAKDFYEVWGDAGYGPQGRLEAGFSFEQSFAALAIESGRTAAIEDIRLRGDIKLPLPRAGSPFCSALATPIWHEGKIVAALCFYNSMPRQWTDHDFSIAEWLASQATLALQSIRFQQELEEKRLDAEDAARQKSRFLAAISHDVRTPANAISLLAELIQRSSTDPRLAAQVPELATNLWNNARLLVDLVSDVLDLTRLDSGPAELHLTRFVLCDVLRTEVEQAKTLAGHKQIAITADLPEEEILLSTDRTKLSRIISNLLANAVKFTEAGEVAVACRRSGEGVEIQVRDTGCGIPAEAMKQVFDEFFQLRNPERDRQKGTGLGLAICRRMASHLGASLSVESSVGVGSTFTISLPAALIASAEAVDLARPERPDLLRGMKILLVEDNDVARAAVSDLLTAEGAILSAAANGEEALRFLEEGGHEALLLDLNLPDMDGSEILQRLQSARPPALRRILVITGDARQERVEQVRALGADRLIAKPVSLERIREAL